MLDGTLVEFGRGGLEAGERSQDELDGALELRVPPGGIVLRRDVYLFVRFSAVVLHSPAHVIEPKRELRLRGDAPVDQGQRYVDPDDASPGAGPDDRAQAEKLEALGENVPVRPRQLVGEQDQWPPRCFVWIRDGSAPARHLPANAVPRQFFEHQA